MAQIVRNPSAMPEAWVWCLGWEDLEKGPATHSSILAWGIPWTEEPGGLQFMGSQGVEHNCSNWAEPVPEERGHCSCYSGIAQSNRVSSGFFQMKRSILPVQFPRGPTGNILLMVLLCQYYLLTPVLVERNCKPWPSTLIPVRASPSSPLGLWRIKASKGFLVFFPIPYVFPTPYVKANRICF